MYEKQKNEARIMGKVLVAGGVATMRHRLLVYLTRQYLEKNLVIKCKSLYDLPARPRRSVGQGVTRVSSFSEPKGKTMINHHSS